MLCSSLSFSRDFVKQTAIYSTIASGPKCRMYSHNSENFPGCAQVVVIIASPFLSAVVLGSRPDAEAVRGNIYAFVQSTLLDFNFHFGFFD